MKFTLYKDKNYRDDGIDGLYRVVVTNPKGYAPRVVDITDFLPGLRAVEENGDGTVTLEAYGSVEEIITDGELEA